MTNYFSNFPLIQYNNNQQVLNISLSVKIKNLVASENYFFYTLEDNERPDTVANDYYGDSKLAWLVLLSNNMLDVYSDWVMSGVQLENYIIKKYGSLAIANSIIDHYKKNPDVLYYLLADPEIIINSTTFALETDKSKWTLLSNNEEEFLITPSSYSLRSDQASFVPVTAYDNEFNKNEEKRVIQLIQREDVTSLISSLKDILQNG